MLALKRVLQVLLIAVTVVVAAISGVLVVSQTGWFRHWLGGTIERQGDKYLNGKLTVAAVRGTILTGIQLNGLNVTVAGQPAISLGNLDVRYNLLTLLRGRLAIDSIRLDRPVISIERRNGRLNLSQLLRPRPSRPSGGPPTFAVDEIRIVGGTITLPARPVGTSGDEGPIHAPERFDSLDAQLSVSSSQSGVVVDIARVSFNALTPQFDLQRLSGTVAVKGGTVRFRGLAVRTDRTDFRVDGAVLRGDGGPSFDLHVDAARMDFVELGRLIPTLTRFRLEPSFDVNVKGPTRALDLDFRVRSGASGIVSGHLVENATAPDHRLSGTVHVRNFDLNPMLPPGPHHSDVTGVAQMNIGFVKGRTGTDVHGNWHLKAEHASAFGYGGRHLDAEGRIDATQVTLSRATVFAYGAPATTSGRIQIPHDDRPIEYDLRGHATRVDLRLLPRTLKMPRVPSSFTLDYHVAGVASTVSGTATLDRSAFTGATIEPGTKAGFSYDGHLLRYTGDGALQHFDLRRFGSDFGLTSIEPPRFATDVNGRFQVTGSGTSLRELALEGDGQIRDSRLFETVFPGGAFHVSFANQSLRATVHGQFDRMNPAEVVAGGPASTAVAGSGVPSGQLAGRFDLTAGLQNLGVPTRPFSVADDLSLAGRIELQSSMLAGMHIDSASVDGRYSGRAADLRTLSLQGPSIRLTATGPIVFNEDGQSKLAYHVETPALDRIGGLLGISSAGALTVDGVVTGNAAELKTSGTLRSSNVRYETFEALEFNGQYAVDLPHLDPSQVAARATTEGAFVKAGGFTINAVKATTAYRQHLLDFDVDAAQPNRHVVATGEVLLQPTRQQLRFRKLSLQSGTTTWQLEPGTQPLVEYGDQRLAVLGVTLTSGDQAMTAEGTIGPAISMLTLRAKNVRLSNIDALTLANRSIDGVLDAQAVVSGPSDALKLDARFDVTRGSFRKFTYQSLAGTLGYTDRRVRIDARLQQSPQAWFAVNGSVPTALFQANPAPPAANDPVDLRVVSSGLDLGVVQGLTTAVRDATGAVVVDARVVGTARAPQLGGYVTVENGSFMVVPTGVRYHGVRAQVALAPDRLTVERLTLADPGGKILTLTGDLAVGERRVQGVNVRARGNSFAVVDNAAARASLNVDLAIGGELRQPSITGTIGVDTGRINVDRLIEMVTNPTYSTTPQTIGGVQPAAAGQPVNEPASTVQPQVEAGAARPAEPAPSSPPGGGPLPGVTIDMRVRMPDDLAVRADDLRVGRSAVGFGKVDVTLGGDVRVEKQPDGPVRLVGDVQTVRGAYEFQGRRFEIQRGGHVRFDGLPRINPSLDVTGTRLISGVETQVHLGGTLRNPDLTLTSNPPLDQADVLSLIIFGQPANQLAVGQQLSLAQSATSIASGFVASTLAQSIGRVLNLDTFEIETAETAGQLGATVTLGEQIGQRLYVRVRQGLGATQLSEFLLDYQLTNFLRLETAMVQGNGAPRNVIRRIDQSQRSGADLIFFFSF